MCRKQLVLILLSLMLVLSACSAESEIVDPVTDNTEATDSVETEEEARAIIDNDPLHKALHIVQEIHPFGHRTEELKARLVSMA